MLDHIFAGTGFKPSGIVINLYEGVGEMYTTIIDTIFTLVCQLTIIVYPDVVFFKINSHNTVGTRIGPTTIHP